MSWNVTERWCLFVETLPVMLLHLEFSMVIKLQTCNTVGN